MDARALPSDFILDMLLLLFVVPFVLLRALGKDIPNTDIPEPQRIALWTEFTRIFAVIILGEQGAVVTIQSVSLLFDGADDELDEFFARAS